MIRDVTSKILLAGIPKLPVIFAAAVAITTLGTPPDAFSWDGNEYWVGTWSTALHAPAPGPPGLTNTGFDNQTLRQIVRTSVSGDQVRVRFSTFGASSLAIGAAHIALRDTGSAIVPGSDRTLTFSGRPTIVIPSNAPVISDPVEFAVPEGGDLAISIFVPGRTGPATWHFSALQTSYVSPPGDFTASAMMPVNSTPQAWFWLAGVEVMTPRQTGAIVAFGDSITDGTNSTRDTNRRWPDHLARRLLRQAGNDKAGVLNASITGNRLLHDVIGPNALSRFDRDVLSQTGVTHVIVLLGNNDIGIGWAGGITPSEAVTVERIIQGYIQLIQRTRARGIKIYGGTLTPFEGAGIDAGPGGFFAYFSPANEAKRQAVNAWIRTSREFDAVIDFDEVVRDPSVPTRLRPLYDSGDHLHPNDAGYQAISDAIDLKLFKNGGGQ
jgi:lysophospholipase L1-like esterase